jgi:hypothetical protein
MRNIALGDVEINFTPEYGGRNIKDVFNLTVEDSHEFFANNILVHNCDAVAYLVDIAYQPYKSDDFSHLTEEKMLYPEIGI